MQHPLEKTFTRRNTRLKQSRLDYFLFSDESLPHIVDDDICTTYRSDRSSFLLSLQTSIESREKGFLKFNFDLLHDPACVILVKDTKEQTVNEFHLEDDTDDRSSVTFMCNNQVFIEALKCRIRSETNDYAQMRSNQIRKKRRKSLKRKYTT